MDEEIDGPDDTSGVCALVEDVPDPASVAILVMALTGELTFVERRSLQRAVRGRYCQFTQPGYPDGPQARAHAA